MEGAGKEEYERVIKEFMDNLDAMCYPLNWWEEMLRKALIGYIRVMAKVKNGQTIRNRKAPITATQRWYSKQCGQTSWFRDEPEDEETNLSLDPTTWSHRRSRKRDRRRV